MLAKLSEYFNSSSKDSAHVINYGDFSIITKQRDNERTGNLIISAHGIKVPQNSAPSFFHKGPNTTFETPYDFFRYGPDNSSVYDIGYLTIMSECKDIALGTKTTNLPGDAGRGKLAPANTVIDNKILTPYEKDEKNKKENPEINRVREEILQQNYNDMDVDVWDILVINNNTTLEKVMNTMKQHKMNYERVVGYFCHVGADGLDHREKYDEGYGLLNEEETNNNKSGMNL